MGWHVEIVWHESEAELKRPYQHESHPQRRTRLQALWLLRQGKSLVEVAQVVGVHPRTLQSWAAWYRQGGLSRLVDRLKGQGAGGRNAYLTPCNKRHSSIKWRADASKAYGRGGHRLDPRSVGHNLHRQRDGCAVDPPARQAQNSLPPSCQSQSSAASRLEKGGLTRALNTAEVLRTDRLVYIDEIHLDVFNGLDRFSSLKIVVIKCLVQKNSIYSFIFTIKLHRYSISSIVIYQ